MIHVDLPPHTKMVDIRNYRIQRSENSSHSSIPEWMFSDKNLIFMECEDGYIIINLEPQKRETCEDFGMERV